MWNLPNLQVFTDCQDTYCWDYQTFNGGIEENEEVSENPNFLQLRHMDKLENLAQLRVAKIHWSQLSECTTYLKVFKLRCNSLQEWEVTTDQNFAPQRAAVFYANLYDLLIMNAQAHDFN